MFVFTEEDMECRWALHLIEVMFYEEIFPDASITV